MLDAFVAAGGGTEYADLDSVRVIRLGADRRQGEIQVDLARMLKQGDLGKNLLRLCRGTSWSCPDERVVAQPREIAG